VRAAATRTGRIAEVGRRGAEDPAKGRQAEVVEESMLLFSIRNPVSYRCCLFVGQHPYRGLLGAFSGIFTDSLRG
jgi:hypothetical protein